MHKPFFLNTLVKGNQLSYALSNNLSRTIIINNIPLRHHARLWSSLIPSSAQGGLGSETVSLEEPEAHKSGPNLEPFALVHLIRECANLGWFMYVEQLHCHVLKSGWASDVYVSSAMISLYVKFEAIIDAHRVFVEIPEPSIVSWNTLISGYARYGKPSNALSLFFELERSGLCADSYTFTPALSACGQLSLLHFGESIHSKIVRLGMHCSVVVGNSLIDMYGKCGYPKGSIRVFNGMIDKDTISWNSVIAANARNRRLELAFGFLHQMPHPDSITYNELISGIAQFGEIEDELLYCQECPTELIFMEFYCNMLCKQRQGRPSSRVFSKMHFSGMRMDQFTFSSILSGTAGVADITWGRLIHCCTVKNGLNKSVVVGSALVDMYSKCGDVNKAEVLFETLPSKNLVTCNAMISGYANNGDSNKVLRLFEQMKKTLDLQPDGITFLNILSACWHNKVPMEVAKKYFESMVKDYGIAPTAEHCSSMIRLMGREGVVEGGENMIKEMGFEKCALVWRALLGACVTCGDIKVAEVAAEKVIGLEGESDYVYVLMSNVYASYKKWKDVKGMRMLMKGRQVTKGCGHSWIESLRYKNVF